MLNRNFQKNLLRSYDLPTEIPKINKKEVLTILMGDKKVRDGKMRFILPKEIGADDKEILIVSPIPSKSNVPRPIEDFTLPGMKPPASVIPKCSG